MERESLGIREYEIKNSMSLLGRQLWKDAELELRIEDNRVVKRRARNVDLLIAFRSWVETEPTPAEEEGV
jgi:hypothetical protein